MARSNLKAPNKIAPYQPIRINHRLLEEDSTIYLILKTVVYPNSVRTETAAYYSLWKEVPKEELAKYAAQLHYIERHWVQVGSRLAETEWGDKYIAPEQTKDWVHEKIKSVSEEAKKGISYNFMIKVFIDGVQE